MKAIHECERLLGVMLTADERRAFVFLTARGQKFCVHFGYQNALDKAHEIWRAEGIH